MSGQFLNLFARMRGGVVCPKCGAKVQTLESGSRTVTCGSCGYAFSLAEALVHRPGPRAPAVIDPDRPPADTNVFRCELAPDVVGWEVPPSGKFGSLMVFAVCWLGFIGFFTGMILFAGSGNEDPLPFLLLFALPFWGVGIAMLYAAVRTKYAKHFIAVDADSVMMSRVLFNRTTRKILDRSSLESLLVKEFYQKNHQPSSVR